LSKRVSLVHGHPAARSRASRLARTHSYSVFYAMVLPAFAVLFAFSYIPLFGIIVAFKDYNYRDGIWGSPWSGMKNFQFLFRSGKLGLLINNTLLYNIIFIIMGMVFAVLLAILVSEVRSKWFKKIAQSATFLPNFMSWVIISTIFYNMVHPRLGVINTLMKALGEAPVDVYTKTGIWYWLLPVLRIWKTAGFGSIIYFAAIMGIDQECYESAKLDGANVFQEIWHITLPMLKPTIVIVTLLNLGGILRGDFDMFYQIIGNNGLLFKSTDIIDTYVFRTLMRTNDIGMSSAAGFFQSLFCFVFILIVNLLVKRIEPDYALF